MRKLPRRRYSRKSAGRPPVATRRPPLAMAVLSTVAAFLLLVPATTRGADEIALLADGRRLQGRLESVGRRIIFRCEGLPQGIPAEQLTQVWFPDSELSVPTMATAKIQLWDGQALHGRITQLDDHTARVESPSGTVVSVPRAALAGAFAEVRKTGTGTTETDDGALGRWTFLQTLKEGRRQADRDLVVAAAGEEAYGRVRRISAAEVELSGRFGTAKFDLSQLRGIYFRRERLPASTVSGLIVEVLTGGNGAGLNRLEGALVRVHSDHLVVRHPFLGNITLPRTSVRSLTVQWVGTRVVIDPTYHHLGNEVRHDFDIAEPEGNQIEMRFELSRLPHDEALLALWVHDVEGVGSKYERLIADGRLQTAVLLNGQPVDILNRHVQGTPRIPVRIRLPLPAGALKTGTNRITFLQTPRTEGESEYDDCGLQGVSLEMGLPLE